jgi:hypothetical protein
MSDHGTVHAPHAQDHKTHASAAHATAKQHVAAAHAAEKQESEELKMSGPLGWLKAIVKAVLPEVGGELIGLPIYDLAIKPAAQAVVKKVLEHGETKTQEYTGVDRQKMIRLFETIKGKHPDGLKAAENLYYWWWQRQDHEANPYEPLDEPQWVAFWNKLEKSYEGDEKNLIETVVTIGMGKQEDADKLVKMSGNDSAKRIGKQGFDKADKYLEKLATDDDSPFVLMHDKLEAKTAEVRKENESRKAKWDPKTALDASTKKLEEEIEKLKATRAAEREKRKTAKAQKKAEKNAKKGRV